MNHVFTVALRAPSKANTKLFLTPSPLQLNRLYSIFAGCNNSTTRRPQPSLSLPSCPRQTRQIDNTNIYTFQWRSFSHHLRLQARARNIPRQALRTSPNENPLSQYPTSSRKESRSQASCDTNANPNKRSQWRNLTASELTSIFAYDIPTQRGNYILSKLQDRRESGSLAELGINFSEGEGVRQEDARRGLEWLRQAYPLDEQGAAVRWAESEALRLEEELRTDLEKKGQRFGLLKRDGVASGNEGVGERRDMDASSVLVQRQKQIKEERKIMEERKKEDERSEAEDGVEMTMKKRRSRELSPWAAAKVAEHDEARAQRRRYTDQLRQQAELDANRVLANRSAFSRLFPATLFTLIFLSTCYLFSQSYTPPSPNARLMPEFPPSVATFVALFILNQIIFIAWKAPSAWKILNRYFLLSAGHPRALSLLGNTFSHQMLSHLAVNMSVLFLCGTQVHDLIGRGNFIAVYLGTGVLSSLASLYWHVLTRNFIAASVGSSGAIFGIIGCYFALKDRHELKVPLLEGLKFEYRSDIAVALIFALELACLVGLRRTNMDHASHVGGLVAGYFVGRHLKEKAGKEAGGDNDTQEPEQSRSESDK